MCCFVWCVGVFVYFTDLFVWLVMCVVCSVVFCVYVYAYASVLLACVTEVWCCIYLFGVCLRWAVLFEGGVLIALALKPILRDI